MVWGRPNEEKEDVFAPFNLDEQVDDNEKALLEKEKRMDNGSGGIAAAQDVFADFHLDDIVRENEEASRRKRQQVEEQKAAAAAASAAAATAASSKRKGFLITNLSRRKKGNGNNAVNGSTKAPTKQTILAWDRRRPLHKEEGGQTAASTVTTAPSHTNKVKNPFKPVAPYAAVEKGSSLEKKKDALNGDSSEQPVSTGRNNKVATKVVATNGGKTAAMKPRTEEKVEEEEEEEEYDDDDDDDNGSTTAQGGVDIVDDRNVGRDENDNNAVLHWESSTPDVDNIFADFDLDAIVRDYVTMQRKLNYAPPDDLESVDSDLVDVERYGVLRRCFNAFPRMNALLFHVLIPLWLLVGITIGLGYLVGRYEDEAEYERNDAVMRNRFSVDLIPFEELLLYLCSLPAACLETYLEQNFNITTGGNLSFPPTVDLGRHDEGEILILPEVNYLQPVENFANIIQDLSSFMQSCGNRAIDLANVLVDLELDVSSLTELDFSLTFNWIRCWNTTELGEVNPFYANTAKLEAAGNQSNFYEQNWRANRIFLQQQYLEENNCTNSTSTCSREAFLRSIEEATGRAYCNINLGSSAWLWFMVLTTVGYGNVFPATNEGRLMVVCLGWLSIITFGLLLAVAGRVVGIIVDDVFRKLHLRWFATDSGGALLWGALATAWIYFLAEFTLFWWRRSLDDPPTTYEALWFSYISLLTVGLGDYYIESEFIFMSDLFIFTFIFLTGFTFISTFIDKMSGLCSGFFPDYGDMLAAQLHDTQIIGLKSVKYKEQNEKALHKLGDIVEKMDDDSVHFIEKRAGLIRQKKEILIHLLYQTEQELDHFKKRGEKHHPLTIGQVSREENMLMEILDKTSKERENVEHYRKRGKALN